MLNDAANVVYHTITQANTYTLNTNANVAYPVFSIITVINGSAAGNITIKPVGALPTIRLAGTNLVGSRNLIANGMLTITKVGADEWYISGIGLQ